MVTVQILAELEEVIQYKSFPERREGIKLMWWERLKVTFKMSAVCKKCE